MFNTPDGTFPNGIPNPLLHDQQPVTGQAVRKAGADFGVAFDGDFDRCFFWDHEGTFIEGYYVVGMLAEAFLQQNPGARIVYDPRLTWNTEELVASLGGEALPSQSGHAFIKETMRQKDAIYGGEMSAHHYFKSFAYCDSGMIPWLTVLDLLARKQTTLAALVKERMARYPSPGRSTPAWPTPTKPWPGCARATRRTRLPKAPSMGSPWPSTPGASTFGSRTRNR